MQMANASLGKLPLIYSTVCRLHGADELSLLECFQCKGLHPVCTDDLRKLKLSFYLLNNLKWHQIFLFRCFPVFTFVSYSCFSTQFNTQEKKCTFFSLTVFSK